MRFATLAVILVACGDGSDLPTPPAGYCDDRCTMDHLPTSVDDCCGRLVCWYDADEDEWHHSYCDVGPDRCAVCGADEVCVQTFDGVCGGGSIMCVPKTFDCPNVGSCSADCEAAYCPSPYQCATRSGCDKEARNAFTCYGF